MLICIVTFVNIAVTALAADDDFVAAEQNEVLDFLYDYMIVSANSNAISFEVFCNMVNDDWGWTWDADTCTYTDVQTGYVYGIMLDSVGVRGLARSADGGGGGRHRVESADDIEISGETFADIVARLNEHYAPNSLNFISYKKDKRWGNNQSVNSYFYWTSLYFEGIFCNKWTEIYLLPATFVDDNYYSIYNIHLSQAVTEVDGANVIYLDWEVLSALTGEVICSGQIDAYDFATVRYFDLSCKGGVLWTDFRPFDTYSAYLQKSQNMSLFGVPYDECSYMYTSRDLANSDFSTSKRRYDLTPQSAANDNYDSGFIVSDEPILLGYDCTGIEVDKIDKDAIINLGGDTIYDYTITNTSGDSTTINEYVTNNYTYITNNEVPDGGNTGGDVNVKGEIAVGGEVDINVNINDSLSSMPVEVDVDNYIDVLPEQARPVTNLMKIFFDWLPVELMSLILAGVAVAVILRIWGR